MAYTIGASHGPFSGAGNFVISKPAGIRTVLSGIPAWAGRDGGSPERFFRMGRYTLGNVDGFSLPYPLEYAQQLVYPIAPTWELLAYDIRDGASCLFQELVDPSSTGVTAYWSRNPVAINRSGAGQYGPPQTGTVMWTYTVPAGRGLYIAKMNTRVTRVGVATAVNYSSCQVQIGGLNVLAAYLYNNVAGASATDDIAADGIVVPTGSVIQAVHNDASTGGTVHDWATMFGVLFDL